MYFPYVFGKGSELLALRSANDDYLSSEIITPIIEPVLSKTNGLVRCLKSLGEEERAVVVITNPYQGDFKNVIPEEWKKTLDEIFEKYPSLIPGILLHSGVSFTDAKAHAGKYKKRKIAMLYRSCTLSDAQVKSIAGSDRVKYHIILQQKISKTHLAQLPTEKLVHVVDGFNRKPRNADYGETEPFSDTHKTYKSHSIGFGDYTVIGEGFQTGGGLPGAVALHITYHHSKKDEIWIHHFLSNEMERDAGTVESKYLEALAKLTQEHKKRKAEFGLNSALEAYFADHANEHCPGLGKNKERQILHHIARVHDLLVTGTSLYTTR